jgi:sigma-E factor negative regulatory protein RseB
MQLLDQAAQAALATSYQGVEIISLWETGGTTTVVANVWHAKGGKTLTKTSETGAVGPDQAFAFGDASGQSPEGVLGVTKQLVGLIGANYEVVMAGGSTADDRPAQVVEARRQDGSLAARFWLDQATKFPLRREVFDSSARVISEDAFLNVAFGASASAANQAHQAVAQGAVTSTFAPAQLSRLRAGGWPAPAGLPGGLSLFGADEAVTRSGSVLDLRYSDGLYVVSLFLQRGNLAPKIAGWQKVTLEGRIFYAGEPDASSLTWSARGFVYTVLAEAPPQTVGAVVHTLPHDTPPGFWGRLHRGFARLASWVNPFG